MSGNDIPAARTDWAFFLDVDGTLLEIAATPNAVHVDRRLLRMLDALHRACHGAVALVTGRALVDLERRFGDLKLPRVGQHGLERRDAAGRYSARPGAGKAKESIRQAVLPMVERLALGLEDKGMTLAVHCRQRPELEPLVLEEMTRLVERLGDGMVVQPGKCVVEVKPAGVDKGTAIEEFLAEPPFAGRVPVCIGDDLNDEHGFAVVNRRGGISIKVGEGDTGARYRMDGVDEVRAWLEAALGEENWNDSTWP